MSALSRSESFFAVIRARLLKPRVEHRVGLPTELAGTIREGDRLAFPEILVIEKKSEGNVFLFRLTRDGSPCGDTWHQSIEDARHQAEYEYGDVAGSWQPIPQTIVDPQDYALARAEQILD